MNTIKSIVLASVLTLILALVLTVRPSPVQAQSSEQPAEPTTNEPSWSLVRWTATVGVHYLDATESTFFMAGASGSVPLRQLLPQVSPDSRIRFADVRVFVPTSDDDDTTFDAQLLDISLHRSFWSGGVHLVDMQRSGIAEREDDWIGIHTGPGWHRQSESTALSIRSAVQVSWSTAGVDAQDAGHGSHHGHRHDDDHDHVSHGIEHVEDSGLRTGLSLIASARYKDLVTVTASASHASILGSDLTKSEVELTFVANVTERLQLWADLAWEEWDWDERPVDSVRATGGLAVRF